MNIEIENIGDLGIVTPHDEQLDSSNYEDFIAKINVVIEDKSNIVLDMKELDFIDSSGLSSFAHIIRRSRELNGRFCVCSASETIQDAFDLAHIDRVVEIYETREDAIGSFKS